MPPKAKASKPAAAPKAKASKPAAAPKAKASKAATAPLACVASVLQDEDLMAIVLEQGGRLERSMGGKGSALASLKPKSGLFPFTVHRDALYVVGAEDLGVLSLNGVLRQKIRIPVPNPMVTEICVDDKHAYVNLYAIGGFLGGGRNATGLYILEKVQPAAAGSSA